MATLETQSDALAEIYAKSLFDLAMQEGGRERVESIAGEMEEVLDVARANPQFIEFLRSAILPMDKREKSLGAIFKGRISDLLLRFLLVLNRNERLGHVGAIQTAFDSMVQERFGRVEVDVFTAAPLDQGQLQHVADRLRKAMGREPVLHNYTDTTMIGGLRLQIGDQLIDASVATRLRRMRDRLSSEGGAQVRAKIDRIIDEL
jgi:F-type H+-transporting ATPase subunit delta